MNKLVIEWATKKPPRVSNKTLVDFQILKRMTSQKNTQKTGQSVRSFTNLEAEVALFYYDVKNKHLSHMLKQRGFDLVTPFLKFRGDTSYPKNYRNQTEYNYQFRGKMINEAKRFADYVLVIKGEPSKVLSESLKKIKGSGHNRTFLADWEHVTTYNITDHINHVEDLAVKEIAGDSVEFGVYNLQEPSDILLTKIKISGESFETISSRTGVPLTMIYRHTQNKAPIGRQHAIQYAKYFGMDPAEILFNPINLPVEGTVSFENDSPGEVKKDITSYTYVSCPRDIYRPDVQCIKVDSPTSIYHNCNLFFYQDIDVEIKNNQICVFIFYDRKNDLKQVIGRYSGANISGDFSIKNPDPQIYEKLIKQTLQDLKYSKDTDLTKVINDDFKTHCTLNGSYLNKVNIGKSSLVTILPVVAVVNREMTIKDTKRASIIKDEEYWYKMRTYHDGTKIKNLLQARNKAADGVNKVYNKSGKVDEGLLLKEIDLDVLDKKLKIIEKKVKEMGYPEFKLPDPKMHFKEPKNENLVSNKDYVEPEIRKDKTPSWLLDPEIPVSIERFIQDDPKKASEFFANEDEKLSEEALPKMKFGTAKGPNRAVEATEIAINKIKKESQDLNKVSEVLIVITGSNNVRLEEVDAVINRLRLEMKIDTEIIFGCIRDENMEDSIRVSILSVAKGKIKDEVLIQNALSNFYFYRSIGARKEALRMALGSPALNDKHREEVIKKIAEKTPEVLSYKKAEIYPFRRTA